jgi:hypothetical protein
MLPPPNRTAAAAIAAAAMVLGEQFHHASTSLCCQEMNQIYGRESLCSLGLHDWKRLLQHSNNLA